MDINYEKTTYTDFPLPHLVFGYGAAINAFVGIGKFKTISETQSCIKYKGE
jgi:hypothetical protein